MIIAIKFAKQNIVLIHVIAQQVNKKNIAERGWKYCRCLVVVAPSGYIFDRSCNDNRGVCPLCTLKSNIFVQRGEK